MYYGVVIHIIQSELWLDDFFPVLQAKIFHFASLSSNKTRNIFSMSFNFIYKYCCQMVIKKYSICQQDVLQVKNHQYYIPFF